MVALAVWAVPGVCSAAEPLGRARPGGVRELLASVTLLSDAQMSSQTAEGVRPAPIVSDQAGHARVLLWDEMRAPPELPPGTNGTVTLSTGGPR